LIAAWADYAERATISDQVPGDFLIRFRYRYIPPHIPFIQSERLDKSEKAVHDMLPGLCRYFLISEQPLPVPGTGPVETQSDFRAHEKTDDIRPHGWMHVQKQ
jgi:hypothetical protein